MDHAGGNLQHSAPDSVRCSAIYFATLGTYASRDCTGAESASRGKRVQMDCTGSQSIEVTQTFPKLREEPAKQLSASMTSNTPARLTIPHPTRVVNPHASCKQQRTFFCSSEHSTSRVKRMLLRGRFFAFRQPAQLLSSIFLLYSRRSTPRTSRKKALSAWPLDSG